MEVNVNQYCHHCHHHCHHFHHRHHQCHHHQCHHYQHHHHNQHPLFLTIFLFFFAVVNKANVAFLVEGFFPKNLGYIRKFIYNIIRTFSLAGTYVTLMDYGDAQYRVANWVQLRNGAEVRKLVRKLPKSNRPARRTGLALQAALNTFATAPAGNLNILILITKGKSSDDVIIPAANLRKKGRNICHKLPDSKIDKIS